MSNKNYASLKKAILAKAREKMDSSEMHGAVHRVMREMIIENVYNEYRPIQYERRRDDYGGLTDINVLSAFTYDKYDSDGFNYFIRNTAKDKTGMHYITPLIERGHQYPYDVQHDKILPREVMEQWNDIPFTPYYEPRPFIKDTADYLKGNAVIGDKLEELMMKG